MLSPGPLLGIGGLIEFVLEFKEIFVIFFIKSLLSFTAGNRYSPYCLIQKVATAPIVYIGQLVTNA
jgi:hypothetical protein